ncbi:aspartic proteinase-like protein 2 [Cucurbita maxima]|uniref:Aspartic proteinase-like protein 2 n=1 Tax=Cucurbita maxima TaxID=3661 RepID=A0A6J1IH74_CUCMA|nr:aspartic proteinase-like protein 2 [Cucurbita maxima]
MSLSWLHRIGQSVSDENKKNCNDFGFSLNILGAQRAIYRVLSAPITVVPLPSAPSRTVHQHTMSPPSTSLHSAIFVYCLVGFNFLGAIFSSSVDSRDFDYQQRPVILPLYISPTNSTHQRVLDRDHRLRHLLNLEKPHSSNARMRLYDDLLTNGYYTTRLWIGTPPQEFALIVDTGSTVTYVPCSNCVDCGNHQDPRFQPKLSSSYQPVKCNIDCSCDDNGVQCTYERRYAEMSTSSGVLAEDIMSFGKESELLPQRAVFGCETMETGDLYTQRADGIMGLGRGTLSVMDQLVGKGAVSNSFSLCYGGMDVGGGAMVLGGISSPPGMVFTHSDTSRSPYYNIELKEIHVAGKPLKLNPKTFDGKYGSVLDSGTTYAYFPEKAYYAFKDALMKKISFLKQINGPDPNFKDICFSGAGRDVSELSKVFPEVAMVFANGQKISLSPENYLFRHTKVSGAYCLGIFKNGNDQTTLLGGIIVRNTLVTYDRENTKIGFWKTNCSELWKNLHYLSPAPPPAPLPSYGQNTSNEIPPPVSPTVPFLSGEFQVGVITFNMVLHANKSSVKLNITELAEFIANELEVNVSQVHMLNFTSGGTDFFIRWAIFPADSAGYISNSTAMDIISRLKKHDLQLPEKFGSYQLVELNVEPPLKKTWMELHFWSMMSIVAAVTLVVGLAAGSTWLIWRYRRRELSSYEPVGAVGPEQELQPL